MSGREVRRASAPRTPFNPDTGHEAAVGMYGPQVLQGPLIGDATLVGVTKLRCYDPPSAANASGEPGDIRWSTTHLYICVATDTWKRVALSTW